MARSIQISGKGGVPKMGSGVSAVVLTLTSTGTPSGPGKATVWPDGAAKPNTTALSLDGDAMRSNTVTVPLGANGKIRLSHLGGVADYIIDVQGWYANPVAPTLSCPVEFPLGEWTNEIPAAPIECIVLAPPGLSEAAILFTSVDGNKVNEAPLSGTAATSLTVSIPAVAGWHTVEAGVVQNGGSIANQEIAFGLNDGTPSAVLAAAQRAQPEGFQSLTEGPTSSVGSVAVHTTSGESASTSAVVATDPEVGFTITAKPETQVDPETGEATTLPGVTIGAGLPEGSTASHARVEAPGVVSFDNQNGSHTLTVVKEDASVQNFTVIDTASAPDTYAYPFDSPSGSSIELDAESGMIWIYGADRRVLGGMTPAWARDSDGEAIPTHYIVNGNSVSQYVDLSDPTIVYPVVADPFWGRNLFSGVGYYANCTFSHCTSYGPFVRATPSVWGHHVHLGIPWGGGAAAIGEGGAGVEEQRLVRDNQSLAVEG